jgi:hypothetical protein
MTISSERAGKWSSKMRQQRQLRPLIILSGIKESIVSCDHENGPTGTSRVSFLREEFLHLDFVIQFCRVAGREKEEEEGNNESKASEASNPISLPRRKVLSLLLEPDTMNSLSLFCVIYTDRRF